MPEWVIETGIGESRAALVSGGQILEALIQLDRVVPAGSIVAARLTNSGPGGGNAIARAEDGTEYLLPRGAPGVSEGAAIRVEVMREAIPGLEPWKRPLGRVTDERMRPAPLLAARKLALPAPRDELGALGWHDLIEEARTGVVRFPGGELLISPTPAMTVIDVDGRSSAEELAVQGALEAAKAIQRLGIGGSIGIDLPTVASKSARQAAAAAIDTTLPQPFERTAVNGFGFVQIVRPRLRASLVELAEDRAAFEARALLRRAAFERPGAKRLVAHPSVIAAIKREPSWIEGLARQVGGTVELHSDAALPISAGHAQSAC